MSPPDRAKPAATQMALHQILILIARQHAQDAVEAGPVRQPVVVFAERRRGRRSAALV
jgi:hypothetical protein